MAFVVRDQPPPRLLARPETGRGRRQEGAPDPWRAGQLPGGRVRVARVRSVDHGDEARCRRTPRRQPQQPATLQRRHQQYVNRSVLASFVGGCQHDVTRI